MATLLLDIDGIMVPAKRWTNPNMLNDGFYEFTKVATFALRKILIAERPDVVLISSHRNRFSTEGWKKIFKARGLDCNLIEFIASSDLTKAEVIKKWIEQNPDEDFVIIDDDLSLNSFLDRKVKRNLVSPYSTLGLDEMLANQVLSLFQRSREKKS